MNRNWIHKKAVAEDSVNQEGEYTKRNDKDTCLRKHASVKGSKERREKGLVG